MSKPDNYPVPDPYSHGGQKQKNSNQPQAPLSGSKKTKKHNHTPHLNPEGS